MVAHCDRHLKVAAARAVSFASIRNTSLGWWRVALDRTPCGLAKPCEGESAALLGGYRLMRNDEVSPEAIREGGLGCVARQARSHPGALLAVEGATSMSYAHAVAAGWGPREVGARPNIEVIWCISGDLDKHLEVKLAGQNPHG